MSISLFTQCVRQALQYLKKHNVHYKDVEFNDAWVNEFCKEEENVVSGMNTDRGEGSVDVAEQCQDELLHDREQHCMLLPVDVG